MTSIELGFALPFALMCLFLLLRRIVPPGRRTPATRNQTFRLVLEFGGGLALLAYAAWQLPGDAREDQAYRSEWGCRQGTQLAIGSNQGACSVHKASLSAHVVRGTKGDESYFLDIDAWATGNRQSVEIAPTEANMIVWNEAKGQPGTPGLVQFVNGRAVLVSTDLGTVATEDRPADRMARQELLAALGAGLVCASLLELLIGRFILPAGW